MSPPQTVMFQWVSAWMDRYEARITAEVEALRHAAPGVPPNALRVDIEKGSHNPLQIARYYASLKH